MKEFLFKLFQSHSIGELLAKLALTYVIICIFIVIGAMLTAAACSAVVWAYAVIMTGAAPC